MKNELIKLFEKIFKKLKESDSLEKIGLDSSENVGNYGI